MGTSLVDMQRNFLTSMRNRDAAKIETVLLEKPISKPGIRTYIHAYSARLVEALDNDHPCLGAYLGDSLWQSMCTGYIEKYPSQYCSLRNFGDLLPEYLQHADEFRKYPEISELAQLERQFLNCFDAPDADRVDFSVLLGMSESDWPVLQLSFHPSLLVYTYKYNTMEVWQAMKSRAKAPQIRAFDNYWLLWRDADCVSSFRSVDYEEYHALLYCLHGGNFSQLCALLLESHGPDEVPAIALGLIKSWCADGWVIHISADHRSIC